MRIELTKEEAAQLMASRYAIEGAQMKAQNFITQINAFIARHQARQRELAEKIRERVEGCPEVLVEKWDFSGIDPVTFEGAVEIGEQNEDDGRTSPRDVVGKNSKG